MVDTSEPTAPSPKIKCVVWDLDNTMWAGTLAEGDSVHLRPGVENAIRTLDQRGILQSISSKNDHDNAWQRLKELGLDHYFLYPQIHWNSKAESIRQIATDLNIGLNTFAFLDDQPFEREEVTFNEPEVRTYAPDNLPDLLLRDEFNPRFITIDSSRRREMYQSDLKRKAVESTFSGPNEAFLETLAMVFTVRPAQVEDLRRAEELTERTNQLNTTGRTYSFDEFNDILNGDDHILLVAELTDKFGSYGKIGLVLIHTTSEIWTIELFLMSCRVMSRGVGGALITFLRRHAKQTGVGLRARFRETDRNRMMYITYKFAGFRDASAGNAPDLMENDLSEIPELPSYLTIDVQL